MCEDGVRSFRVKKLNIKIKYKDYFFFLIHEENVCGISLKRVETSESQPYCLLCCC